MRRFLCTLLAVVALALAVPVQATVNSSTNKTIALGNGSQTAFTFNFIGVAANYITVILTDSSGSETVLTQGSGATQYQIALNAPVQGALWGLGGTVTYNPSGTPIPAGSTLTIYRTLPLTQAITLQNQASIAILGKGAETGLDTGVMQGQQINERSSRAIVANITNSTPPDPLPAAAAAAGQGVCFDSTGNSLIACTTAPIGVISSAMTPVVGAASLSAGRTAFGLGSMAVENINSGSCGGPSLGDDGSGNARVVLATAQDSTNQSVTCNFHLTQRIASGPLTYTLGKASSTYFNGFGFWVQALAGVVTVTPDAADNFQGVASGTGISIPQGTTCWVYTNASGTGTWWLDCNSSQGSLSASASASALTIVLNAPELSFRDTTLTSGASKWASPAGGLSITIPSGASLGTSSSNVPFRVWIFVAYNSGTPVLGVATCSISTGAIYPCAGWETIQKSGTGITAGATSAGTLYTASAVSNDAIRIVGYADYGSGLATAGAWASAPTTLQSCLSPNQCRKPGDVVQVAPICSTTSSGTTTSATFADLSSGQTCAITPTSKPNLIRLFAQGSVTNGAALAFLQFARSSTLIGNPISTSASQTVPASILAWDAPGVTTAVTYNFQGKIAGGATLTYPSANSGSTVELSEIMG